MRPEYPCATNYCTCSRIAWDESSGTSFMRPEEHSYVTCVHGCGRQAFPRRPQDNLRSIGPGSCRSTWPGILPPTSICCMRDHCVLRCKSIWAYKSFSQANDAVTHPSPQAGVASTNSAHTVTTASPALRDLAFAGTIACAMPRLGYAETPAGTRIRSSWSPLDQTNPSAPTS